ncbi:MAG TPA: S9 family peptidase, partial [Bacteroidales bacterium]|nr:S9 family peptidase [Bacteroidales bacterium]
MKKTLWPILFLLLMACTQKDKIHYPETRKVDTVDNYFGTKVPDPYRWLEDDNSPETKAWVRAEDSVTENYLSKIPFRNKIKERLTKVWNYEKMSTPFEQGGKYFYRKNNGLQDQDVFYVQDNLQGKSRVLIDPNKLSEDGTVAVSAFSVSKDGKYLAYGLSTGGSDWVELHVKNINSGEDLPDLIKWVKFSNVSWYKDGFYYSRYAAPKEGAALSGVNEYQMVYFHKLGTPQDEDKMIYRNNNDPKKMYAAAVTEDENYMLLIESDWTSRGNELYVRDLNKDHGELVKLTENLDYSYTPVAAVEGGLFVITNNSAPNKKLIRYDLKNPGKDNFSVIIPEKKDVLDDCSIADKKLLVNYMKDVHSVVEIY